MAWSGLETVGQDLARASNKPSRSLKLYYGVLIVNSVLKNVKVVVAAFNQEKALLNDYTTLNFANIRFV